MNVLAPIAPQVIPGRAIDIADIGPIRGLARVDRSDPVFFDHPLDHVPGMLLVAAGLELADHGSMLDHANVTVRLNFTKFCELDGPVEVTAAREPDGAHWFEFVQFGRGVANARLAHCGRRRQMKCGPAPALQDGLISSELVHRTDRRNVAIGPLTVEDGRVWTGIRKQPAIGGLPPRASAVATILEATRQLTTVILHRWGGHPFGTKMIFVGFTAELPTEGPPDRVARALSWAVTAPDKTNKLSIDLHEVGSRAKKVGSVLIAARCASDEEYAQLRAA
ncbi:hypothetical protein DVS77_09790 [Mycolicibacterium moriokaense]|nr:hypothetical protein DVS77_09790 [Mycolicibacterium moriokaense]